jgi:magnesium transporter
MVEYLIKKGSKYITGNSTSYLEFSKTHNTKEFLCVLVQNPDDSDILRLCSDFKIDSKPFYKFKDELRSLRYNFNPLIFTFTDYYTENGEVHIEHLLFVVKNNALILVTSDKLSYYNELFSTVVSKAMTKKNFSAGYILYEFLHQDAKENYDVIEAMDDKLELLEKKILENSGDRNITSEIVSLKKEFIDMSKRLWASSKIIFTIKKDLTAIKLTKDELSLLDDIYDTFIHQIDLIETHKETLTDYLEIYTTTISNKLAAASNELNVVMKKMTAMTIIIMFPTLIAGIYGMNFDIMPELYWRYGYLFSISLMIASAFFIYKSFHKRGWI